MYNKKTLIAVSTAAVLSLLASAPLVFANDADSAPNAHQTQLDEQFARTHSGIRGVPYATHEAGGAYGYVPPAHTPAKTKKR